jgi:hypothetical protein
MIINIIEKFIHWWKIIYTAVGARCTMPLQNKKNPLAKNAEGNRWVGVGLGKYIS